MAVIINIREKMGVIVVIVIALAITAFLLMDALRSQSSLLRGNTNIVGEIEGKEIAIQDFEQKVSNTIENYKEQQNTNNVDAQTTQALRQETWDKLVNDIIMEEEYEELGITVTADEMLELVEGKNPHPAVRQAFTDPKTGQFDPQQVVMFIQSLDVEAPGNPKGEKRRRWLNFENYIREDRLTTKFSNLVKKSLYIPQWEAEEYYKAQNQTANIKYLRLPYTSIPDEDVSVTEDELQKYLDTHAYKFKQEDSRSIEYVTFDIIPTKEDSARALKNINAEIEEFKKTKNDSLFIRLNSDLPFDYKYYPREELISSIKDTFFTIDTNQVIGPYQENGRYVAAKLLDRKMLPDSVHARQILLTVSSQDELNSKRQLLDTLLQKVRDGADFDSLVTKYSDDKATVGKGGDLGWIKPGEMYQTINDALFYYHKKGDVFKAGSPEGFHLIQILDEHATREAVKVAFLVKQILPSSETEKTIYAQASEFANQNRTAELFRQNGKDMNIKTANDINKNTYMIPGLGYARELVRWALEASKNDVSTVFSLEDKYVVALLTEVKEKGVVSLENVRTEVEQAVLKEKKAKLLSDKLIQAKSSASTLEDIGKQVGAEVEPASSVSFSNSFISNAGNEPKLIGAIFSGVKEGTINGPVAGDFGVYLFTVESFKNTEVPTDLTSIKSQMTKPINTRIQYQLIESLKKSAAIEDNRFKFY